MGANHRVYGAGFFSAAHAFQPTDALGGYLVAVGVEDEPHATGTLAVGVARRRVSGEAIQRVTVVGQLRSALAGDSGEQVAR